MGSNVNVGQTSLILSLVGLFMALYGIIIAIFGRMTPAGVFYNLIIIMVGLAASLAGFGAGLYGVIKHIKTGEEGFPIKSVIGAFIGLLVSLSVTIIIIIPLLFSSP